MTTITKVYEKALAAAVATMLKATLDEANIKDGVTAKLDKAGADTWNTLKSTLRAFLNQPVPKPKAGETPVNINVEAGILLDAYRDECKEAAKTQESMKSGIQYAANLRRVLKLREKTTKPEPKELWDLSRSAWLDSPVWAEAGILSPSGAKGKRGAASGNTEGTTVQADEEGPKVDPELSELFKTVSRLKGQFRSRFLKEATELAIRILSTQKAAGQEADEETEERKEATA